jgi:hypothetical protein
MPLRVRGSASARQCQTHPGRRQLILG